MENIEDLYLEHKFHNELIPDRCSECYLEEKILREDKRSEEAEQAQMSDLEELSRDNYYER